MERRKLGKSNVSASVITFGAWAIGGWMWGGADRKEAIDAIRASYDLGVTSIDTAPAYGHGLSEEIVGEAIRGIDRGKVQILTKYGLRWDTDEGEFYFKTKNNSGNDLNMHKFASKESIVKEVEVSLKRLNTDYIDLYQIHWADPTTPVSETMEAMERLIEQGKIKAAGVCNYSAALMKEASKYVLLASNQIPFNMLRRENEKEVIPYAMKHDIAIIVYSPLQKGLLTGKMKPGYHFNDGDSRRNESNYTDENLSRVNNFLNKLKPLADEKNATLAQLVIRWTIQQPGITIVLVGARNPKQATENAGAIEFKLSKEEIYFINNQLSKVELVR
ncbi:MAG: aldo/keto reductase [Ignavibacteriaceae bacterium]